MIQRSNIFMVQVRLRTEVPRTPSSTRPEFELMTSRSWEYSSCHWDVPVWIRLSNKLAICDPINWNQYYTYKQMVVYLIIFFPNEIGVISHVPKYSLNIESFGYSNSLFTIVEGLKSFDSSHSDFISIELFINVATCEHLGLFSIFSLALLQLKQSQRY